MSMPTSPVLRKVLATDAIASGAMSLLLIAGSGTLAGWFQLPASLLFWAGLGLAPWAVLLVAVSRRPTIARWLLLDIVLVNALWAAVSCALVFSSWVQPNALGAGVVIVQAVAVAGFALAQAFAMRAPARRTLERSY